MYAIGDLVVYGSTGVCKITEITEKTIPGTDAPRLYYSLVPCYQNGTIFTPVDTKVFMRNVISEEEIEKLLEEIPSIEPRGYYCSSVQLLTSYYESALKSYRCLDLIKLNMSIYAKKKELEQQNRKLGQIDTRFMKRAEALLHGELAIVLGIDPADVPQYIRDHINFK